MPVDPARAKFLFLEASDLSSPADQAVFLDRECGGDPELRARVEALLAVQDQAGPEPEAVGSLAPALAEGLAEGRTAASGAQPDPAVPGVITDVDATETAGIPERSGTVADPTSVACATGHHAFVPGQVIAARYKLQEVLGEGGMGTVYRADQIEPVKRQVALKVIKIGMDSRTVLGRFDAERQALALMDHPNIARVYDGGTTDTLQPFFVMELVQGVPITEYCDRKCLTVQARLELFITVCRAVQHAHQKGIIHRDLKPSNVLVTEVDGRPTPKVIDFGVAKATGFELTDQSLGDTGAIVGTPTYMSPEQADPASMDIDTRTDVYALGVILYELLTGSPPLDSSQFKRGALLEMLRMVREVDPPRPSTKVSTADALPNIAAVRGVDSAQLKRMLLGDLDWIAMKALEKDRSRRYETASGLAADVMRHLATEPVVAAPPSQAYRMRKFVRKHRRAVIATSLVFFALVTGIAGTTWGMVRAGRARDAETEQRIVAEDEKRKARQSESVANEQRTRAEERETQAIDAVKRFRDAVADEPELKNNQALESLRKRLLKEPLAFFKGLRDRLQADKDTRPESLVRLAEASFELGTLSGEIGEKLDALVAHREALANYQKLADAHPAVTEFQTNLAVSHNNIGNLLQATGQQTEAMKAYERALAIRQKLADANPGVADFQSRLALTGINVGHSLRQAGQSAKAMEAYERALAIWRKLADANSTVTEFQRGQAVSHEAIGILLHGTGHPAEALEAYESALASWRKLAGANPTVTEFQSRLARIHINIGGLLGETGHLTRALKAFEAALESFQRLKDANPSVIDFQSRLAECHQGLSTLLRETGQPDKALKESEAALAISQKLADANPTVIEFQVGLAESFHSVGIQLETNGRPAEAMKAYERALAIWRKLVQEHPMSTHLASLLGATLNDIAVIEVNAKRYDAARARLQEAIALQRKALAPNPAHPQIRRFLSKHLTLLIRVTEALRDSDGMAEAQRELAKLRESDPGILAFDARLAAIIKGVAQPRDEADRLALAQRAYDKALHATAARLWSEALEANPVLGEDRRAQHRYNAACSAAQAGCGHAKGEAPSPDDAARSRLRKQALDWLRAELATWSKRLESDPSRSGSTVAQTLAHWQVDPDLAGIRDEKETGRLPEAERLAFQQLWSDVNGLLTKAKDRN